MTTHPPRHDWRGGLIAAALYFLLCAICDPAPAAPIQRIVTKEITMQSTFKREEEAVADLLALVGANVPPDIIAEWSDGHLAAAEDWAAAVHFRASDNAIRVPPMPGFLAPFLDSEVKI